MKLDLSAIRARWSPAFNDEVLFDELIDKCERRELRSTLSTALADIHELLKLAELLREGGLASIALTQLVKTANESDGIGAALVLRNAQALHAEQVATIERVAVQLAGGA